MTKETFINKRTEIISKMLDNPDKYGIYPTTAAFAELDDLFDQLVDTKEVPSGAQSLRNRKK